MLLDKYSAFKDWRDLVEEYSKRKLTQERDKLNAISGLAQMIEDITNLRNGSPDTYLAGLWASDLIPGLVWCVYSPDSTPHGLEYRRPLKYRAPTWSWASVEGGPINYDIAHISRGYRMQSEIVVNEVQCTALSSYDRTGPVTAGHIVVTGLLAPVQLVNIDTTPEGIGTSLFQGLEGNPPSLVRGENLWSYAVTCDLQRVPILSQEIQATNAGPRDGVDARITSQDLRAVAILRRMMHCSTA
jgi:hypothetical protein